MHCLERFKRQCYYCRNIHLKIQWSRKSQEHLPNRDYKIDLEENYDSYCGTPSPHTSTKHADFVESFIFPGVGNVSNQTIQPETSKNSDGGPSLTFTILKCLQTIKHLRITTQLLFQFGNTVLKNNAFRWRNNEKMSFVGLREQLLNYSVIYFSGLLIQEKKELAGEEEMMAT